MSVEVSKNSSSTLIPEISTEIFNNLNTRILLFGNDKSLIDINNIGLKFINGIYPEINSSEQAKELTLDKIFNKINFPGWLNKFESANNDSSMWIDEYLTANIISNNVIFSIKAGQVLSKSGENLFVVFFNDVTIEKKTQHRLTWLEKQDEKGSMASIIVHDLNNHLSLLLGGAELTELSLKMGKIEKAAEKIEKLKINVRKMEKFIAGFTDEYQLITNKKKGDINSLISNVVSYLSTKDMFFGISLIAKLESQIPEFEFDLDQFSRLLLNFLYNSAEAIIESEIEQGKITVKTELVNNKIYLVISDNGPGITQDIKEKIFNRRFTTKENHTGYGLMTCGCIVGIHNGQVEIGDDVSDGVVFKIILPVT